MSDPTTRRLLGRAPRTRSVIAATGVLVICIAPFAAAHTGGNLREGVRNGTTTSETQIISNIGSTLAHDRRLLDPAVQPLQHRRRRDLRLPLGGRRLGRQAAAAEPVRARQQPLDRLRL